MADYDDDIDLDENDNGEVIDDWEDEEELLEQKAEAQKKREEDEVKRKEEVLKKKQEKQARLEAARGNVEDDIDDIDQKGEKEYKDRLARHDVEITYGVDSNQIEAKPLAAMMPENNKDLLVMGDKMGECMRIFRTNKFYNYAVNLLVTRACERLSIEDANDLDKKLNVLYAERTKALKESSKKKLKEEERQDDEATPARGNAVTG
eukprot:gene910-1397_t